MAKSKAPTKKPPAPKKAAGRDISKNASPSVALSVALQKYVAQGCVKAAARFDQELKKIFANTGDLTAANMAHIYVALRKAAEAWYEAGQFLVGAVDDLKENKVPDAFEKEGITNFSLDTGQRVTISNRFFASIAQGQKETAYKWLRDNNLGDLIVETVNASTLSAAGKVLIEEGKELPEPTFTSHFKASTSMTGGKKYKNDK